MRSMSSKEDQIVCHVRPSSSRHIQGGAAIESDLMPSLVDIPSSSAGGTRSLFPTSFSHINHKLFQDAVISDARLERHIWSITTYSCNVV